MAGVQRNGCTSRCYRTVTHPKGKFNSRNGSRKGIYKYPIGIKKCPANKAERLTCALTRGLPLFYSEGKGTQKSRNRQTISGFSVLFRRSIGYSAVGVCLILYHLTSITASTTSATAAAICINHIVFITFYFRFCPYRITHSQGLSKQRRTSAPPEKSSTY